MRPLSKRSETSCTLSPKKGRGRYRLTYGSRVAALAAEFAAVNADEHSAMLIGQLLGA